MEKQCYNKINEANIRIEELGKLKNLDFNKYSLLKNEFKFDSDFQLELTSGVLNGFVIKMDSSSSLIYNKEGIVVNKICYKNNYILERLIYEYKKGVDYDSCRTRNDMQGYLYQTLYGAKFNKLQQQEIKYSGDTMNSWKSIVKYLICGKKDYPITNEDYYIRRNNLLTTTFNYKIFGTIERYNIVNEFAFLSTTMGNSLPFICKRGSFNVYRGCHLNDMIDKSLIHLKTVIDDEKFFKYTGFKTFIDFCDHFYLVGSFVDEDYKVLNLNNNMYTNEYSDIQLLKDFEDTDLMYLRLSNINDAIKKRNNVLNSKLT